MIIGAHVEKKFGCKWYIGRLIGTDIDTETNENLWQVKYDDDEYEDCDEREMNLILCTDKSMLQILRKQTDRQGDNQMIRTQGTSKAPYPRRSGWTRRR